VSGNGAPIRPLAAPNGGIGKELPRDQSGYAMPAQPRNRRERRALAAWQRKQARNGDQT